MGNKKKDKEKREGSSSSLSGNECEKTKNDNPPTPKETPKKDPEKEKTQPMSPEMETRMEEKLEANNAKLEAKIEAKLKSFAIFNRGRSESTKRPRDTGNSPAETRNVRPREQPASQQHPRGAAATADDLPASQGHHPKDTSPLVVTQNANPTPPPPVNAWEQRPPNIVPEKVSNPTLIPKEIANDIAARVASLKVMEEEIMISAVSENIPFKWAEVVRNTFAGYHELISTLTKTISSVPKYVQAVSERNAPQPAIMRKLNSLNVTEVNKTINTVKTSEREKEIDKCGRSIRLFNIENNGDENAYSAINRAFNDLPLHKNYLAGSKCHFLGNPKTNRTVPVVVEFLDSEKKSQFMNVVKKNEDDIRNSKGDKYSASIHWPKDIADRLNGWKKKLSENPDFEGMQFYFSYRSGSKQIRVGKCKIGSAERVWEQIALFPIPPKLAKEKFKGLPEILGGDPKTPETMADNVPTDSNITGGEKSPVSS